MNNEREIRFNFDVSGAEAQTIIEALGEMPYKKVVELVFRLQNQAQEQVQKYQEENAPKPPVVK